MKKRFTAILIAPALLIGLALVSESQETRTPTAAAPNSPPPETSAHDPRASVPAARSAVAAKTKELSAKEPATVAAAAYWLGEQGSAAIEAIPQLVAVLGDDRQVNPARYRKHAVAHPTRPETSSPGEEAAVALVNMGEPAVEALINVLKSSPSAVARQNAAWALGVIQERHKTAAVLIRLTGENTFTEGNR